MQTALILKRPIKPGDDFVNGLFKAAVFDLDGTLLYTLTDLVQCLNEVLAKEGLPQKSEDEMRFLIGNGLEMMMVRALPEGLRQPEHVRPLLNNFLNIYNERQSDHTRPYEGIPEVLKVLKKAGLPMAVLSNKAHPNTLVAIDHFFPKLFNPVLGLRAGAKPKPDPAGALEIAAAWGLKPSEVAYFGDTGVDMKTALSAGMHPVGVTWGYRPVEELTEAGAAALIDHPGQIANFFSKNS